jgi:Trk-type K+ transport system membrane component
MIIGAAPMSTGGGLKVTTVYVAFRAAFDNIRGKNKIEVRKRQISGTSINNAYTIIVLYFTWMLIAVFGLTLTEKNVPVFTLLFETVSALSTVGLSLNFSPLLTTSGKLIIITTMLVGRIGILTFFTAFVKNYKSRNIAYPQEDISM